MKDLKVGDKVKITEFYSLNYPSWKSEGEAIIISINIKQINHDRINKENRHLYYLMYGNQKEYPLLEMKIKIDNQIYIVSQFGFN